jgi:hypothetical protein
MRATGAAPQAAGSQVTGASAYSPEDGYTPKNLHNAYQLPTEASSTQTIALVDAYNDLTAEHDLGTYDSEFSLPACTTADKCFTKVNQNGEATSLPFPQSESSLTAEEARCDASDEAACEQVEEAAGWSVEISLDIETARAICQNCHIMLVEADSPAYANLEAAENSAARLGAEEISNSWAGPECVDGSCVPDSAAFDHPGVVITAAAGDDGYRNWLEAEPVPSANFPASSPHVVAVGGTRLLLTNGGAWKSESVWNDGGESAGVKEGHGAAGGGCSATFTAPLWQQSVGDWASVGCEAHRGLSHRALSDVAADADPYTGVAVYDSYPEGLGDGAEWSAIGGTSLASPLIAATFALAGGSGGVKYPARTLYENVAKAPTSLHDVTAGSNGECTSPFEEEPGQESKTGCSAETEAQASCSSQLICMAASGYDGPTGLGTPDGISAFVPAAESGRTVKEESEQRQQEAEQRELEEVEAEEALQREEAARGEGSGHAGGSSGSGAGTSHGSTSGSSASSPAPPVAAPAGVAPTEVSGLTLTLRALIALNRSRPKIDQLAFTFALNANARVQVSLEERVGKRGHQHWKLLVHTAASAVVGRNNGRLGGRGVLGPGAYRLTLAPVGGIARSLVFKIG